MRRKLLEGGTERKIQKSKQATLSSGLFQLPETLKSQCGGKECFAPWDRFTAGDRSEEELH
ncbi:MAG: hypothetical protein HN531_12765 [Opitutae bacterium]|nr:hypothetical protein [Opitutae bacterium]